MNTLEAKGNRNIGRGRLRQIYAQLADEDPQFVESKEDKWIRRIQKHNGQIRKKIEHGVGECCD
jgi:hypothetical protein